MIHSALLHQNEVLEGLELKERPFRLHFPFPNGRKGTRIAPYLSRRNVAQHLMRTQIGRLLAVEKAQLPRNVLVKAASSDNVLATYMQPVIGDG